jgi:hypothetical protein
VVGEPVRTVTEPKLASSAATAWARASEDDSTIRFMDAGRPLRMRDRNRLILPYLDPQRAAPSSDDKVTG